MERNFVWSGPLILKGKAVYLKMTLIKGNRSVAMHQLFYESQLYLKRINAQRPNYLPRPSANACILLAEAHGLCERQRDENEAKLKTIVIDYLRRNSASGLIRLEDDVGRLCHVHLYPPSRATSRYMLRMAPNLFYTKASKSYLLVYVQEYKNQSRSQKR